MKHILIKTIAILLVFLFNACTEEITVNAPFEAQTIIYGEITNHNSPVTIRIQQSVPLNSTARFRAVNDATISLFEKNVNGNIHIMTSNFNVNQGVYVTTQPITTTIGNSYWIEVTLSDGTRFRSQEEVLNPVVPISSIELGAKNFTDILYINFQDPSNAKNFYRTTVQLSNFGQVVYANFSESSDVLFNGNNNASLNINLFGELNENEPIPIYNGLVATLGNVNFSSYQFLLNQRSQIWTNKNDSDADRGSPSQLFATPPVNLIGNITNLTKNKNALGNFTVISISSQTF